MTDGEDGGEGNGGDLHGDVANGADVLVTCRVPGSHTVNAHLGGSQCYRLRRLPADHRLHFPILPRLLYRQVRTVSPLSFLIVIQTTDISLSLLLQEQDSVLFLAFCLLGILLRFPPVSFSLALSLSLSKMTFPSQDSDEPSSDDGKPTIRDGVVSGNHSEHAPRRHFYPRGRREEREILRLPRTQPGEALGNAGLRLRGHHRDPLQELFGTPIADVR